MVSMALYIIIRTINKIVRKRRFIKWKSTSISLSLLVLPTAKFEFGSNEDSFSQELWEENQRLSAENLALKREKVNLSIRLFLMLILTLLVIYFRTIFNTWGVKKK